MPRIELSRVRLESEEVSEKLVPSSYGYDASFGHAAAIGGAQVVKYATRTYVGESPAGGEVRFTLPNMLEGGCRVSIDYGGFVAWLISLGTINLAGRSHRIGSYEILG